MAVTHRLAEQSGYHSQNVQRAEKKLGGVKGQAVVIDALFFLMICGFASAILMWAGSVYGNTSFEAFKYMYLNDYETTSLAVLGNLEYNDEAGVSRTFLTDMGDYMIDAYNETSPPGRFDGMYSTWKSLCDQSPAPLLLTVFTSDAAVRGNKSDPLYFACGELLTKDRIEQSTGRSLTGRLKPCTGAPRNHGLLCDEDERTHKRFLNTLKYPYYSSPLVTKACGPITCEMEIKLYY